MEIAARHQASQPYSQGRPRPKPRNPSTPKKKASFQMPQNTSRKKKENLHAKGLDNQLSMPARTTCKESRGRRAAHATNQKKSYAYCRKETSLTATAKLPKKISPCRLCDVAENHKGIWSTSIFRKLKLTRINLNQTHVYSNIMIDKSAACFTIILKVKTLA